jgi:hypothetical protein
MSGRKRGDSNFNYRERNYSEYFWGDELSVGN